MVTFYVPQFGRAVLPAECNQLQVTVLVIHLSDVMASNGQTVEVCHEWRLGLKNLDLIIRTAVNQFTISSPVQKTTIVKIHAHRRRNNEVRMGFR